MSGVSLTNQTILVTGGSSGLGRETARALAAMGAQVVIAVRDQARGEAAARTMTGGPSVLVRQVDLLSQADIRRFAAEFQREFPRLQVLVNNAGRFFSRRALSPDGLEATFALNHMGYFLLTNLLWDLLRRSGPSRIVNVASEAQAQGYIDWSDLQGEKIYIAWKAYCQSKRANVLFTQELARRLAGTGVTANCVHPGVVATGFAKEATGITGILVKLIRPFMIPVEKGADTAIWLASAPELANVTGTYFQKRQPIRKVENYTPEMSRRLWEVSEGLLK